MAAFQPLLSLRRYQWLQQLGDGVARETHTETPSDKGRTIGDSNPPFTSESLMEKLLLSGQQGKRIILEKLCVGSTYSTRVSANSNAGNYAWRSSRNLSWFPTSLHDFCKQRHNRLAGEYRQKIVHKCKVADKFCCFLLTWVYFQPKEGTIRRKSTVY